MFQLSFEIAGEDKILKTIDGIGERVKDFSPAFENISQDFYRLMKQQFTIGGYTPWQPLTDKYAAWKARVAPGQPIMVLFGGMRDSLTTQTARGSINNISPRELKIGTSTTSKNGYHYPYAHQHGLGNNPVRKVIEVPVGTASKWVRMIRDYAMWEIGRQEGNWKSAMMEDYGFEES